MIFVNIFLYSWCCPNFAGTFAINFVLHGKQPSAHKFEHLFSVGMSCEHSCGSIGGSVAHPPEGHAEHNHDG